MRRVWGSVLVGLGVFLVVLAGMLRFWAADQLTVTPKDQYSVTVAPGSGTYFDPGTLQSKTSDLVARRTVKGDVNASNDTTGVWDVSLLIETGDGTFVRGALDRVAFDRKSGESVHCCGEAVDSQPVQHSGLSYKFPFDTKKQTYQWWDPNSSASYPAEYKGEETVQGLKTYKFVELIAAHQILTQDTPGSLLGSPQPSVQAPVFYQNTRTVWVEPRTGVIIKGMEENKTTIRDAAGQDKITVLQATFTFDDPTQRDQVKLANDAITKINTGKLYGPIGGLVLGLILIVAGAILLRRSDSDDTGPQHAANSERAPARS
jgi:Porin PorA